MSDSIDSMKSTISSKFSKCADAETQSIWEQLLDRFKLTADNITDQFENLHRQLSEGTSKYWNEVSALVTKCKTTAAEAQNAIQEAKTAVNTARAVLKEVGPIATSVIAINDIIEQQNYRQKISAAGESGKNRLSNLGWFRTFLLKKATGMSDEEIAKTGHILGCANGIYELLMADQALKAEAQKMQEQSIKIAKIISENYDTEKSLKQLPK